MRKLGKTNQVSNESVEAFFCFCVVCACNCRCGYLAQKYYPEMGGLKANTDNSRRSSQTR